jgi:hypothetical protein
MLTPIGSLDSPAVTIADAYGNASVWFAFRGSNESYSLVCIDCRPNSPTKYRMFDQTKYPGKPEGVLIELGSDEEGLVISLVSEWLDSTSPNELGMNDFGWKLFREALIRHGEPFIAGETRSLWSE